MQRRLEDLEWMLDHEMRIADRYGYPVSVALFWSPESLGRQALPAPLLRDSDICLRLNDSAGALLLSRTDYQGALCAVSRLRNQLGETLDLTFAIASYPQDLLSAPALLSALYGRLLETRAMPFWTVLELRGTGDPVS